ncbi:MAG: hypothetical protein ABI315_03395 [Bacteroidia bacterium]
MANFSVKIYSREKVNELENWLKFYNKSINKTLFHSPIFLSYHKHKFNEHHLAIFKGEALFGILPLSINEQNGEKIALSPYGGSFGGILLLSTLGYGDSKNIIISILDYFKNIDVKQFIIVPQLFYQYEKNYSDTFNFCLLEQGFKIVNSDITNVINLKGDIQNDLLSSNARNMARKALKFNIRCEFNSKVSDFWEVMNFTFEKHGTKPTHSYEEWCYLMGLLPSDVWCDVAYFEDRPIAGIGHLKINKNVDSSFYLCNDVKFQHTQALSLLITESLKNSQKNGFKYFDFGTSSMNMIGKESVFNFKENFGAVGYFRNTLKYIFS